MTESSIIYLFYLEMELAIPYFYITSFCCVSDFVDYLKWITAKGLKKYGNLMSADA